MNFLFPFSKHIPPLRAAYFEKWINTNIVKMVCKFLFTLETLLLLLLLILHVIIIIIIIYY
jgi:hypothetical protein